MQRDIPKGSIVTVRIIPAYFRRHIESTELRLETDMLGEVIGWSATGKVAVEFNTQIWSRYHTDFSVDCHGKGKPYHCAYFPSDYLIVQQEAEEENKELDDEACQFTYQADRRLLLLVVV